jgi:NADH-quinone oxidoreductase subunit L
MLDLGSIGRLAWLIPGFTALAFVVAMAVVIAGARARWAAAAAVAGISVSALLSLLVLAAAWRTGAEELAVRPFTMSADWLPMGTGWLTAGILIDPLSATLAAMVTLVCAAIFVYSTSYMAGELTAYRHAASGEVDLDLGNARYARFFAFVSLFATGMLGFVLAGNLIQALLFWEVMGLCSFLLIGFWYHKPSATAAAIKAFLTTRVGDIFLLVGILVLFGLFGTVDYTTILSPAGVDRLRAIGTVPGTSVAWSAVIALLVFGGAVGKSAQFPLHVWLPDAMEGPTPVSALIHAATMVSAGVFLVARMHPLFSATSLAGPSEPSGAMFTVAFIGGFTALFAATIATTQFDIKRVLAYSTISQLGYMFLALGIGAYVAAVFHLITHAFFKALLFLASGSVIHGVEHGAHEARDLGHRPMGSDVDLPPLPEPATGADPLDPQDMRNMGNLRERMPFTFLTFLAGALALTGVIPFAGFWSKDEILGEAFYRGIRLQDPHLALLWLAATGTAFLTAFYMARQVFMVFYGPPHSPGARHAPESDMRMVGPLLFLALFATFFGVVGVHESFPVVGPLLGNPFHQFLGRVTAVGVLLESVPFDIVPMLISLAAAFGGWAAGWWVYGRNPAAARAEEPLMRLGTAWQVVYHKYYVDEIYQRMVVGPFIGLSRLTAEVDRLGVDGLVNLVGRMGNQLSLASGWVDRVLVDGAVNLTGIVTLETSQGLRRLQTGRVQQYLLVVMVSVLFLIIAYIL